MSVPRTNCPHCQGPRTFDAAGRLRCVPCRNLAAQENGVNRKRKGQGLPPLEKQAKAPWLPVWADQSSPEIVQAVREGLAASRRLGIKA